MVSFKILGGAYGNFIATYLFTTDGNTSSLTVTSRKSSPQNPSWLAAHPSNSSLIYATNEPWPQGFVQSYTVNSDGSLNNALDTISTGGDGPAHMLALSNGFVVAMNYNSGNGKIYNMTSNGARFNPERSQFISFPKASNQISHPHQIYEHNNQLFIPDLGLDTVWRLVPNDVAGSTDFYKLSGGIPQTKGSGPRHMEIYQDRIFLLHELSARLTLQKIPPLGSTSAEILADVSIVPSDGPSNPQWAAAEVLIPPPTAQFPTPYIYVSNRNKGRNRDPRGDTIAIFEHINKDTAQEGLRLVKQIYTGCDLVRGMAFGPKGSDEFLIAGSSEGSKGTAVFQRIDGGRDLKLLARETSVGTRTSYLWLP